MKDVAGCEKRRGGPKQPLIRRSPNGETPSSKPRRLLSEFIGQAEGTWRTETSYVARGKENERFVLSFIVRRLLVGGKR